MRTRRISVFAAIVGLTVLPASAFAQPMSQQADTVASPAPAAAEPAPATSASAGFAQELAQRLAESGNAGAADREDRAALVKFYAARQHEPVWTSDAGFTPAGLAAVAELRRADEWGLDAAAFQVPALSGSAASRASRADAEIVLGLAILKYARHARGGRAEPTSLSRNLDRKLALLDPALVVDQASKADNPAAYLQSLHPQHPQFEALRRKYLALRSGAPPDPSASGGAGKGARKATGAASETSSAQRVLVNMEEWRWMPESLGDFFVWVNIPEYTLRVVKAGRIIHTERVIVGKRDTQTPVFSQDLEQVIFHPFWGIPESIKRNDVLPSLARGSSRLLERYNLRIQRGGRDIDPASVDWASADIRQYHVYQPPGPASVLGVMKFRFPNKHDVYMHDTPTKTLFNAEVRTFSHGCVRVREPQRLAELVLAEDQEWPASRVTAAINGGPQNNQIALSRKIPVHITYFTAMIDKAGELKLFPDIYGHEPRIALGMEGKAHLVARLVREEKPPRADAVGSLAETTTGGGPGGSKKDWVRKAFDFGNN